jgi:hypothetical protein
MKKCPTCQATFGDEKKFCQKDGTPLVEMLETIAPPEDPFKTVVATPPPVTSVNISEDPMKTTVISADDKDNDLLQIPEVFDPMKTVVVSEPMKFDEPSSVTPPSEPVVPAPEPPKFNEPSLTPPVFSDVSANEPPSFSPSVSEPPQIEESPIPNPFTAPPVSETPKVEPPPPPVESTPPPALSFDKPPVSPVPSPFDQPIAAPPPTFDEPQPMPVEAPQSFNPPPPAPTFDQPTNDPFNQPVQSESSWNPLSPPPASGWGDLPAEQQMSGTQPMADPVQGANRTLPFISLGLAVASLCCPIGVLTGLGAVITGFMATKNISGDPTQYGGKEFAMVGMISGGILALLSLVWWVYIIFFGGASFYYSF